MKRTMRKVPVREKKVVASVRCTVRDIPFKRVWGMTGKFKMYVRRGGLKHNYKIRKGVQRKNIIKCVRGV